MSMVLLARGLRYLKVSKGKAKDSSIRTGIPTGIRTGICTDNYMNMHTSTRTHRYKHTGIRTSIRIIIPNPITNAGIQKPRGLALLQTTYLQTTLNPLRMLST
ncbi:hypothetical protein HZH66_012595 [Vespula vulgaris]|uniref:Uncharacterized protein n=1 Tax=Vespula vulgaris TaxID=7454 RepID=A0A834MT76_VESVU|nr:hypothetical protein HZH66_012595 [Vespula vulgaris]